VLPGFVETELASDTPQEYKEALAKRTALGRLGTPEDIAEVVWRDDFGEWGVGIGEGRTDTEVCATKNSGTVTKNRGTVTVGQLCRRRT
jgi:hypothetical protein